MSGLAVGIVTRREPPNYDAIAVVVVESGYRITMTTDSAEVLHTNLGNAIKLAQERNQAKYDREDDNGKETGL